MLPGRRSGSSVSARLLDQARLLDRPNGIVGRMKCISPLSPIGDPVV